MMLDRLRVKVLDYGFVILVDHMGDDQRVVESARVLEIPEIRGEADERLIEYMMKNKHTSPFEHVVFTFMVKAPLFVVNQWQRHRTWSYNEESGRYKALKDEFYHPDPAHVHKQSKSNKQGGEEPVDVGTADHFITVLGNWEWQAYQHYMEALAAGITREQARMILPQNIYKSFYATVNLHNLLKFLQLRMNKHAQWEIRQYAYALHNFVQNICPLTLKYWHKHIYPDLESWREDEARLEG